MGLISSAWEWLDLLWLIISSYLVWIMASSSKAQKDRAGVGNCILLLCLMADTEGW